MGELRETLASPIAWALSIFGSVVGFLGLGPLVDFLAATSGIWSSILIVGGRLAGGSLGDKIAMIGGALFLLVLTGRMAQKTVRYLQK